VYKLSLENTLKSFIQCESITPNAKQALDFIEKILSESDFYIKRLTFNSEDTYPVTIFMLPLVKVRLTYVLLVMLMLYHMAT
jgi:hypothetical protein